ncbi:hypothetical protein ILUMI_03335 [Ignelater luminosus]|uniref:Uncharacterized protein n=1 Tax=Ignelater luminosus TaxID=2038154 RepID=A0A8K0DG00_IGNLU|nr:hypothetical protein ILUMI_03335 [Ignelater luminosus]
MTPSRPFLFVALDYVNPSELKDGKTLSRNSSQICPVTVFLVYDSASISPDPNDLDVIIPSHSLIANQLTTIPERNWMDSKVNYNKRYRRLQLMRRVVTLK